MKTKLTAMQKLENLTDTQKQSLKKIYRIQLIITGALFVLLLLAILGCILTLLVATKDINFAFNTAPIYLIAGAITVLLLLIASDIFFKVKFPYYSDKLYRCYRKSTKEATKESPVTE